MTGFDPDVCDLCGETGSTELRMPSTRSMRSDHVVEAGPLVKRICDRCGLARDGRAPRQSEAMYREEYAPAPADYVFYSSTGPRRRSDVFARWLIEAFGERKWSAASRALEIGAGAGAVMAALTQNFPALCLEGLELCRSAARAAQAARLSVHSTSADEWQAEPYDVIYSIAVLEHVSSPTAFLKRLRTLLSPRGYLFLAQPTQDVASSDILFNDHLHHFGTDHLRRYARKTGFREVGCVVGHDLMPNFSLHCWQAAAPEPNFAWHGPPGFSLVAESFADLSQSFAQFDSTLADWTRAGRRLGVFGLNEVFALAKTYTRLSAVPLCCGLDDNPGNSRYRRLDFPVVAPEQACEQGIDAVVVATNRIWVPQIESRLRRLGLETCAVLS